MKRNIFLAPALGFIALATGLIILNVNGAKANYLSLTGVGKDSDFNITFPYTNTVSIYLPLIQKNYTRFSFRKQLFDPPSTLSLWIQEFQPSTGQLTVNGGDTQQPSTPFTWDWGDGTIEDKWFPRIHTYSNTARNYIVKVTSHYSSGGTDTAKILIHFVPSTINPISLPANMTVTIPNHEVTLTTRLYPVPSDLTYFDDSYFSVVSRSTAEYVLSVAAYVQNDFVNTDVFLINGGFQQIVLRDPTSGGMYSLWYTNPPSFASGNYGFQGTIQYSSFFHEMGHNFTLNSPANYYYGGKIDGNANTIFSESMANIFAHATAYEILNHPTTYGFDNALASEIEQSAISSIVVTRNAYNNYLSNGKPFHSWNDPATPEDETFGTFMTIAYKFCAHAEESGQGYRIPAKRMMAFLEHFNSDWSNRYGQYNNTPEAETFRATLMVTALSYAFSTDLKAEFRDLNFPINDVIYEELMNTVNP